MTQNPTPSSKTQENTTLPTGHYCRKNDAEIQRRIDRGIWRPSLDTGHVYSTVKKANLKEAKRSGDYLTVTDHKQIFRVHRIIWIAAHGIPDAEYQIDHINGNKEDNCLQNLYPSSPPIYHNTHETRSPNHHPRTLLAGQLLPRRKHPNRRRNRP